MDVLTPDKNFRASGTGPVRPAPCAVWMLFPLALLAAWAASAQPAVPTEYKVKAGCLFNFVQFVEWPAAAFADAGTPIRMGVLGVDPFGGVGGVLDKAVEGETINNRKLVIRRSSRVEELKDCHLIFISRSEKARVVEILRGLESAGVLTVGETEGFANRGGVINFYLEGNKVRFEINAAAAQRQGIKINSQMLKLGKPVNSADPKGKE